jgi:formylglycine-generating enzyme required for sulfatase activity
MKLLIVLTILVLTTDCYAGNEWIYVDKSSDPSMNVTMEAKKASIERINSSTVRALTRLIRTNSSKEWAFPITVYASEGTVDFDCNKRRYKLLDTTIITTSGDRVPIESKSVPTFDETPENSMWETTRRLVCQTESKLNSASPPQNQFLKSQHIENVRALEIPYKNDEEVFKILLNLAKQGHADAQYSLGVMYAKGKGATQDYNEAVKWFSKAEKQGNADAQFLLGVMHEDGLGVAQDYVTAYVFYNLAGSNGSELGQKNRILIEEKMTKDQINEAQSSAKKLLKIMADGQTSQSKQVEDIGSMVFVKGGCFNMGDNFDGYDDNEHPVHEVCLDDFYMGKYEVTVGEFKRFIDEKGYKTKAEEEDECVVSFANSWVVEKGKNWRNPGFFQNDSHPVVCVSWKDADAYRQWLSQKSGKSFRLPTEAEWEYAARSGGKMEKWAGITNESELENYAWLANNSDNKAHSVGQKKPNGLGLYDMTGNVWEWSGDTYEEKYYTNSPKNNPKGPEGWKKGLRGGSWVETFSANATAAQRGSFVHKSSNYFGFRLVQETK